MDKATETANYHPRMVAIMDMRAKGYSAKKIGERFGISGQRVLELIRTYERRHKMHMFLLMSQFETLKRIAGR